MKKIITAILSAMLILQSAMCVSAAQIDITGLELHVEPTITLEVKETSASSWATSTTIYTGQQVSLRAKIDMSAVRTTFEAWYQRAKDLSNEAAARNLPIVGNFEVKIEYPQGVTLSNATMTKLDMGDFSTDTNDIFVANGARVHTPANLSGNQELAIPFKVKDNIKVGTLCDYTDPDDSSKKYFPDMEIIATAVSATKENAPHHLYGYLTGSVDVEHSGANYQISNVDIVFEQATIPEAIINVVDAPVGPGGSLSYTLSFESNGGTEFASKSYRNGVTVNNDDLPIPERTGYEFTGWYTDEKLTEKFESVKMTKNVTVYAGWKAKEGPGGPVPEMLNGDDHFAYIIGYPEGDVRPYGNITRAEVATIFFRLLKDEVRDDNLTYENNFADVNEGAWYNGPISTLVKLGILNGKDAETFAPDAYITRAEFATIAARFVEKDATNIDNFSDVAGHWAESDIYEASGLGWIKGYEDNTFRPDRNITRAETMTMINRVLARVPEKTDDLLDDMVKWSDNSDTSAWYYIAVQEATNSHVYERKENEYEKWTEMRENRDWSTYEK